MITINKIKNGGQEFLPYPEDIFEDDHVTWSKAYERNYKLYQAVRNVEMYYQENTPTVNGNPMYSFYEEKLYGLLDGYGVGYSEHSGYVWITVGKKTILKIEKLKLPESYHETKREYRKLYKEVFGQ